MYNKLFTSILDSSIWLEPTTTRVVWITLLASMDIDGFAHFSAVKNLAIRAGVTEEEAQAAVDCFLSPDPNSRNTKCEGRRIERVPGGFIIINAEEYRGTMNREIQRERTRERVRRFRSKKNGNDVTKDQALPSVSPASVTALTERSEVTPAKRLLDDQIRALYMAYPKKADRPAAYRAIAKALKTTNFATLLKAVEAFARVERSKDPSLQFTKYPATWFNNESWDNELPVPADETFDEAADRVTREMRAKHPPLPFNEALGEDQ